MSDQSDNNGLLGFIVTTLEDMRDKMVTKSDLEHLESRLVNKLEAKTTAIRGDIEQVNLQLGNIERALIECTS